MPIFRHITVSDSALALDRWDGPEREVIPRPRVGTPGLEGKLRSMDVLSDVLCRHFRQAGFDDLGFDDAHPGLVVYLGFYEGNQALEILLADEGKRFLGIRSDIIEGGKIPGVRIDFTRDLYHFDLVSVRASTHYG